MASSTQPTIEIDVENCTPQTSSPFFSIPAELRALIYEHVLGDGWLHFRERKCEKKDKSRHFTFEDFSEREHPYTKLSYTLCSTPESWRQSRQSGRAAEDHVSCLQPIHDLDLAITTLHERSRDSHFRLRKDLANIARREHGPTVREATKHLHISPALDLTLLRVCRQIHYEAAILPYTLCTFDFGFVATALDAAERLFTPGQCAAIETVHLRHANARVLGMLLEKYSNVKRLKLSLDVRKGLQGGEGEWRSFFERSRVEDVEVCGKRTGHGEDVGEEERGFADKVEKFLSRGLWERGKGAVG